MFPRAVFPVLVLAFAAAALLLASPRASSQRRSVSDDASRVLSSFDELTLDAPAVLREVRKTGGLTLNTSHGTFDLEVEPFDVRTDNYRAVAVNADGSVTELPRTPSRSWRGTVRGMEGTQVRLTLDESKFEGIIVTPTENFFIEPASNISKAAPANDFLFYPQSSLKQEAMGECGTTLAQKVGSQTVTAPDKTTSAAASQAPTTAGAFAPKPEAEVATEADFEFFQSDGSNAATTNQDIADILTQVDAIYDAQMGIKIRIVFQRVWTANNDPYTSTNAGSALNELQMSYDASFGGSAVPSRDLVHLFTGKELDGSTIGISFISAICDAPDFSYGLSQSKFNGAGTSMVQRVALTAHEMGHNFGASHPDQESPVPPSCSPSIMNSFIQTTSTFCQFSRDQITSHVVGSGGSCLTRLTQTGCTYGLSASSQFFNSAGGAASVGISTGPSCAWGVAEGADWIDESVASGAGPATISYTAAANTNTGPREATVEIGGQKLDIKQAASSTCVPTQIAFGQTVNGSLASSDCRSGEADRPNAFIDLYTFTARAGQRVKIEMTAAVKPTDPPPPEALDTFVYLFGPDGSIVAFDDDIDPGVQTDSRIPLNGFFTLPQTGVYTIEATSFDNADDGNYTLKLSDNASTNSVAFTSSAFSVNESLGAGGLGTDGSGFRVVTVTRSGSDISGTATVDYATSDGTAEQRKDYEQTLGTLVFGPGETNKTFNVFVDDDAFQESPETVNLTLSNPVGTTLGTPSTATLTINSNDASSGPSPVRPESFDTAFFVRQQYLDFLNREPDSSGFQFWQDQINSCGSNVQCQEVRRINVSAAFFLSIEFQETGYLVYRIYKTAYGDATSPNVSGTVPVIRLQEFLPDTQRIGQGLIVGQGNWQTQLETNKQAFALEFVLRQRFLNAFPLSMTPQQFVDKLIQNAGLVLSQTERDQLVSQLSSSSDVSAGRAAVLRAVAENPELRQAEFNRAFVLMQYYGYLRRNPDDPQDTDFRGWKFWLDKLNQFNGDFQSAEMVKAFISSFEYIDRFGTRP